MSAFQVYIVFMPLFCVSVNLIRSPELTCICFIMMMCGAAEVIHLVSGGRLPQLPKNMVIAGRKWRVDVRQDKEFF